MTEQKKQATWSKFKDQATVTMPGGDNHTFDFSQLSNEIFGFYGKKQWLADKVASLPAEEKLQGMIDAYNEAVENGIEFTENGRIVVIGKVRKNAAAPKNMDNIILEKFSTYTTEELEALKWSVKAGLVKISAELKNSLFPEN